MTYISKQQSLLLYPSLAIGLTKSDLDSSIYRFLGCTSHQKEAAILAEKISGWHRVHIMEICPQSRPPMEYNTEVQMKHTLEEWHQKCQWWTEDHTKPVAVLAKEWAEEMNSGRMDRVFEPLSTSSRGLIISAHDYNELYSE